MSKSRKGKFHVNPNTGAIGRCTAKIKCDFATEDYTPQHYETEEAARAESESIMEKLHGGKFPTTATSPIDTNQLAEDYRKTTSQKKKQDILKKMRESGSEGRYAADSLVVGDITAKLGRKPKIALDLDGTVFDFTAGLRDYSAKVRGLTPEQAMETFPEPVNYNYFGAVENGGSGWYDTLDDFFTDFRAAEKEGLYQNLKAYDGSVQTLKELHNLGFDIEVLTARDNDFNNDTLIALKKNGIPIDKITNMNAANKGDVDNNFDIFIDDSPKAIDSVKKNGKKAVAFKQLYSKHDVADTAEIGSWNEESRSYIIDECKSHLDSKEEKVS